MIALFSHPSKTPGSSTLAHTEAGHALFSDPSKPPGSSIDISQHPDPARFRGPGVEKIHDVKERERRPSAIFREADGVFLRIPAT
ncbi:MAG: hypothetical protein ING19_21665 [Azospirillum sp.]|nr:hypothetical protein [Azospirillum sp.]